MRLKEFGMTIQIPRSPRANDAPEFSDNLRWLSMLVHVNCKSKRKIFNKVPKEHTTLNKLSKKSANAKTYKYANKFKICFALSCLITTASFLLFTLTAVIYLLPNSLVTKTALLVQALLNSRGI